MTVVVADGARHLLPGTLAELGAQRVLVVASRRAVATTELESTLDTRRTAYFSGFTANPSLDRALDAAAVCARWRPDAVVAVGGGSAIDTAKLAAALPAGRDAALAALAGDAPVRQAPPLVALPTTAGSGSQVTRFATVYVDGVKASLDHDSLLPAHALVDPQLLRTCPRPVLYASAFDALCHGVESHWSTRATPASRRLAAASVRTVLRALDGDLATLDDGGRLALATAATAAGRAIDITRTTAAHAFSYRLTARYGVPHGVACLLNLVWLTAYQRAAGHRVDPPELAGVDLTALLARGGFPTRWREYGVRPSDIPEIVAAGLASTRCAGNPVELDRVEVTRRLLAAV